MVIANKYTVLFIFLLLSCFADAQNQEAELPARENLLKQYFDTLFTRDSIKYLKTDEEKNKLNDTLQKLFYKTLKDPDAFSYSFDSLRHIGKLTTPDNHARIITWNTKYKDGTFKYFGFILYKNPRSEKISLFQLTDKSDSILNPESAILNHNNWFGALYYNIFEYKDGGRTYYMLFGWDGNNYYSNKKILEILSFNKNDKPIFGKSVFKLERKTYKRMIFEHSIKASMSCKYNQDVEAIVFDHLSPRKPSQTGQYQFYGPDGSFDGLRLSKGKWIYISNIYVTNPKPKKKKNTDSHQ